MATSTPTMCPHCHTDLATGQLGKHCPPVNDKPHPTCTWLNHKCGAVVDVRTGQHMHRDHPTRRDMWPCNNTPAV